MGLSVVRAWIHSAKFIDSALLLGAEIIIQGSGLELNLLGGRWKQFPGETGPHRVVAKGSVS